MNIKFIYQYRDSANYKKHGELIYSNTTALNIEEIKSRIQNRLISGEFFYNNQFNLPDLHFEKWNNEFDHMWHEFIDVEETKEVPAIDDISSFLDCIEKKIDFRPQY